MALAVGGIGLLTNTNQHPLPSGTLADKVLIEKKDRQLTLFINGKSLKFYSVALGPNPEEKS